MNVALAIRCPRISESEFESCRLVCAGQVYSQACSLSTGADVFHARTAQRADNVQTNFGCADNVQTNPSLSAHCRRSFLES